MDEALKAKLALTEPVIQAGQTAVPEVLQEKEAPVATQSKYTRVKSWFKLHPKVKTAGLALLGVTYATFDNAYEGNHDYTQSAKIAGAAAVVWVFAYLKKS